MVEKLAKPPELVREKGEVLQRIKDFSRSAVVDEVAVHEEKGLIKYLLYNQNVLSFGNDGKQKYIETVNSLKVERERKGMELVIGVIEKFGYVPEDMAYDLLFPYIHPHKKSTPQLRLSAHKRAKSLAELFTREGALKKELWKPRSQKHLEYWVWWELRNRDIFDGWPLPNHPSERKSWKTPMYQYEERSHQYIKKPFIQTKKGEFIKLHANEIDEIIRRFESEFAAFGYEEEGRKIFLRCGLTADWILAFEIMLPKALELAKEHPRDWMEKEIIRNYSGVELPKGGSVETWKVNIEYCKRNGINFKNNPAILMTNPKKLKEIHIFALENKIEFNDFLQLFTADPERVKENYKFCTENNIPFRRCLKLLIIPTERLQENYKLYMQVQERVSPSDYPFLLVKPTEQLKRRFEIQ
ncbi:MAG: hypothetical protein QXF56_03720 [Candidatus Micrarchaeia archaeon]